MSGLTRRGFLQASGVAAGSLVLGCRSTPKAAWARMPIAGAAVFDAWLAITPDGSILVHAHKVEMGQGTYTAFATLIGEELRTPPERIELVGAPVAEAFGAPMQGTGGSSSLKEIWQPLRETGARAREMLKAAAAERWQVDPGQLEVDHGAVIDSQSDRRLSFGELAEAAARRSAPANVELTPPDQWRYIGKAGRRVDAPEKVSGRALYGMDVKLPGLRTAVVVHCPHALGTLVSFDAAQALEHPGVEDVFELAAGVAVVARNYWSARSAAAKLEIRWDPGESAGVDTPAIRAGLARALDRGDLHSARDDGDASGVLEEADVVLEAEYALPYLAHATMEPMNCTVAPRSDGCDVYLGTQSPGSVQDAVAAELGLARQDVVVHNLFLGGGFGRRFFADMAAEAAQIAARSGKPIKLVWSREDDMARDFYRPPSLHRLRASLDGAGMPSAWEHALAAPSLIPHMASAGNAMVPQWLRRPLASIMGGLAKRVPSWIGPILAVEGASDHPYAIENVSVDAVAWDPGIPVGIWRSVGHSHNGFVVESFID
jgi:CO/xanthine dehydrogenase Mo-binding subunit